jgi:hypothetical protein
MEETFFFNFHSCMLIFGIKLTSKVFLMLVFFQGNIKSYPYSTQTPFRVNGELTVMKSSFTVVLLCTY